MVRNVFHGRLHDATERCDDGFQQRIIAEDIASEVAAQLKLQVRHPITESPAYREAVRLVETRQGQLSAAINYLTPRVGLDGEWRDVASAWELLALSYRLRITYDRSRSGDGVAELTAARNNTCERPLNEDKASENTAYEDKPLNVDTEPLTGARLAAEQAVRRNPQSALGHAMLASVMAQCGRWVDAMREGRTAFSLDPNDPIILHDFSQILTIVGYIREALEQREILTRLAPDVVPYNLVTADILAINGRRREAIRALERVPEKDRKTISAMPISPGRTLRRAAIH